MKKIILLLLLSLSFNLYSQNEVKWIMSGGLTSNTITIKAKMSNASSTVRALLSTSNPPSTPFIYTNFSVADTQNNFLASPSTNNLQPNTTYYYQIEADGISDNSPEDIGTFKTPSKGPLTFTFVAASCNKEPDTKTYNDFMSYSPLFYLNSGDLHYADPNSIDVNVHRNAFENRVFTRPLQLDLFRQLPIAYIWDDHDYCGNGTDGPYAIGAASASKAYREYIPHYTFPNRLGKDTGAIYQQFEIGRVKFILSDLRSQRLRNDTTAMGSAQKDWFKKQLIDARNRNLLTCWVGSYSWYGTIDDNWALNPSERKELSEFMRDSMIQNLFMINGDAHMFAIDNGSNGDFTAAKNLPYKYPVLQAGPIENTGSLKGGTFSEGTFYQFLVKAAQYGVVNVNDNGGDSICITMTGYKKDLNNESTSQLVSYSFCRKLGAYIAGVQEHTISEIALEIYPNPSSGIYVFKSQATDPINIRITDVNGKQVFETTLKNTQQEIDLRQFSNGIYTADILYKNQHQTKRLIKTK